jgi:ribosome biogenesis GTPase / thiamine phosphate phosphatase
VKAAVAGGQLPAERLASYVKLQDELHVLDAKRDVRARIDEKRRDRTVHKALKSFQKNRGR